MLRFVHPSTEDLLLELRDTSEVAIGSTCRRRTRPCQPVEMGHSPLLRCISYVLSFSQVPAILTNGRAVFWGHRGRAT